MTDDKVHFEKKSRALISLFSIYEFIPENHAFKNSYFACIIHFLITLFISNKIGFRFAIKV